MYQPRELYYVILCRVNSTELITDIGTNCRCTYENSRQ